MCDGKGCFVFCVPFTFRISKKIAMNLVLVISMHLSMKKMLTPCWIKWLSSYQNLYLCFIKTIIVVVHK